MILYINTTAGDFIEVLIKDKNNIIAGKKIFVSRKEAEKLLPLIVSLLKKEKAVLKDIKKIQVVNQGGTFTSLRVGVITANALGYALGVPVKSGDRDKGTGIRKEKLKFDIVEPIYDRGPNITAKKAY